VNAGPLAVAQTFLAPDIRSTFPSEFTDKMDKVFIDFVKLLAEALGRQRTEIDSHEVSIQEELERSYFQFKQEICKLTNCSPDIFSEGFSPVESAGNSLNTSLNLADSTPPQLIKKQRRLTPHDILKNEKKAKKRNKKSPGSNRPKQNSSSGSKPL